MCKIQIPGSTSQSNERIPCDNPRKVFIIGPDTVHNNIVENAVISGDDDDYDARGHEYNEQEGWGSFLQTRCHCRDKGH